MGRWLLLQIRLLRHLLHFGSSLHAHHLPGDGADGRPAGTISNANVVDAKFAQLHVKRVELLHCSVHRHRLTVVLLLSGTIAGLSEPFLILPCLRTFVFAFSNEADWVHEIVSERAQQGTLSLFLVEHSAANAIRSAVVSPTHANETKFLIFGTCNWGQPRWFDNLLRRTVK